MSLQPHHSAPLLGTRLMACLGLLLTLSACGGGGSGSSTASHVGLPASAASINDTNVALIEVKKGSMSDNVNIPYVSVTVCIPGAVPSSSNCRTVDNVLLDTGSTGLRLFDTALNGLVLPPQTLPSVGTVYECAQFVTTLALGTVRLADVSMGGEKAASTPIQVMGSAYTVAPNSRCGSAPVLSTVTGSGLQVLGANGILGVGHFTNDGQGYFSCNTFDSRLATGCALPGITPSQQVQNPVSRFASVNNNGVVVQLSPSSDSGVSSVSGYLIFGVETQPNNRLGAANVVPMNATGNRNYFTTTYKNHAYDTSLFDSGSNGMFFDDASIPMCSGGNSDFYCPTNTLKVSTTLPALNAAPVAVDFFVANATALFTFSNGSAKFVFNNLAAPITNPVQPANLSPYFIWGLPFYLGRSVYTVIEGKTLGTGLTGPLNAFTN